MSEEQAIPPPPRTRRRKWLRRFAWLALAGIAALVWLDGPGQRWLLPLVARHFLAPYQIDIRFVVSGRISSQLALHDIHASGGPIETLRIAEIRPRYALLPALRGEWGGVELRGASLRYDLDAAFPAQGPKAEKEPASLAQVIEQVRQLRLKLRPLHFHLDGQEITLLRGGNTVAQVGAISLDHASHSDQWRISTRAVTWADRKAPPDQTTTLTWREEELAIDSIRVAADLSTSDVKLNTPADARIGLSARVTVAASTWDLQISPGLADIHLRLSDGSISTADAEKLAGIALPAEATLDTCRLHMTPRGFSLDQPDDRKNLRADLKAEIGLRDVSHPSFRAESMALNLEKNATSLQVSYRQTAYGGETIATISGRWDEDPVTPEQWQSLSLDGKISVPRLDPILAETYPLWSAAGTAPATPPAASSCEITSQARIQGATVSNVRAALSLDHIDPTHPDVRLTLDSPDARQWNASLASTGIELTARYQTDAREYSAQLGLGAFDPAVFSPVLAWLDVTLPTGMTTDLSWSGQGNLARKTHTGTALIDALTWQQGEQKISAALVGSYDWPQNASIKDLHARVGEQEILLDASYAPGAIAISRLQHRHRNETLLEGEAHVPWPETWQGLEAWFATEQAWSIRVKSKELPLALANQWLPTDQPLPVTGVAQMDMTISGSPAHPEIQASATLKNIRHQAKPELASADLALNLQAKNQQLDLDGRLTSSRTNPVTLRARMPYRPTAWRKDPALLRAEALDASVDIPQLDLARFVDLVSGLDQLSGNLSGRIALSGTIAAPTVQGNLALANFSGRPRDPRMPPLRKGTGKFTFSQREARVDSLRIDLSGGTLNLSGGATLDENSQPLLDFRLSGNAIPLWRDDNLISRANADIRLSGPYATASIRGSIDLVDSLIYKDVEIIPIGKPFTIAQAAALPTLDQRPGAAVAAMPAPFGNWTLDLAVRTGDPFLIRGNLATGEIRMDCNIGGTLGSPQPRGQAEIRDVAAALPLSRLEVKSGFVRFSPQSGMDPVLDIRGSSKVSNHAISIFVYGNASAPKILLTSEPPLPENEIMTLLATGTTTKGLADGSAAQSRALQLVIEEFRRGRLPLGRRLAPFLERLDDVELAVGETDPYSGRKRSSVKMPFSPQWSVFGGVDGEGKTRSLLLFQYKFR